MFFYFVQYNKLFLINTLLISFFSLSVLFSQIPENDIVLDEVLLSSKMLYTKKEYFFYKKKVLKVYHYVDTLRNVITELDNELLLESKKRKKRKIIRNYKKDLMDRFLLEIKSLTRKDGVILSKLIYRDFGVSVFDLIKEYKGNWSAFWWQNLANLYDGNLTSEFNPTKNKEDFLIEKIIKQELK